MFLLFIVLSAIGTLVCSQGSTTMASLSTSTAAAATAAVVNTWKDLYVKPVAVITEFSRVCIVTSRRPYTLSSSTSYKYIKLPSYKATLTQASDVLDGVFRKAELSSSSVKMMTQTISTDINTIADVLSQGTIQDWQLFLPSTMKSIANKGNSIILAVGQFTAQLEEVIAFFDELLRAVQPSSASTKSNVTGSASTQTNKSPLDIDHVTAISNIFTDLKSWIAVWNQMAQQSRKLALLTDQARQVKYTFPLFIFFPSP